MIGEFILRATARPPEVAKVDPSARKHGGDPLQILKSSFPGFLERIRGRAVLDYGCGYGEQVRAMAASGARGVVGFDVSAYALGEARAASDAFGDRVTFTDTITKAENVDVVTCQNSFEHFLQADYELCQMLAVLRPGGSIFITFGPPWHSPWGAHMDAWCRLPWIQNWPLRLLFPEDLVMKVRRTFRKDAAGPKSTYRSVGLGKMTVRAFEDLMSHFKLKVTYRRYSCCWGLDWLQRVPIIREWFINHISVIVEKEAAWIGAPIGSLKSSTTLS